MCVLTNITFRINTPQVIRETFEDEVVIVNLETGSYYSLDNVGAKIWELIEAGRSEVTIAAAIVHQYQGDDAEVAQAVARFLQELQQEELVLAAAQATAEATICASDGTLTNQPKPPFIPPRLHKYTDMQELLLLDPIHEVDATGWPNSQATTANEHRIQL